ncbi:uncharacterized protein LOC143019444 [Oratosquilla oratoria]|uniref:uncharacterized protein LOC143019444 n=1 Tax=Oratosquilla oratoria TaxID=337810 RepID=UPI003F76D6C9
MDRKVNRAGKRPGKLWEPSKFSELCSDHFEEECFEMNLALSIGFMEKTRRHLKPDAVPSIFAATTKHSTPKPKKKSRRSAFDKRRRLEEEMATRQFISFNFPPMLGILERD